MRLPASDALSLPLGYNGRQLLEIELPDVEPAMSNVEESPAWQGYLLPLRQVRGMVPSQPDDSVGCECDNIFIDTDYVRLGVRSAAFFGGAAENRSCYFKGRASRRRWFAFSAGLLFVSVTLFCVLIWSASQINWIRNRHEALKTVDIVNPGMRPAPLVLRVFGETGIWYIRKREAHLHEARAEEKRSARAVSQRHE